MKSELKTDITFLDKDGTIYALSPLSFKHIQVDHCIADPIEFVKDTLLDPFTIVQDKEKSDRWIYHRDYKTNLYKVVVVCRTENRIKTAFITHSVRGGKILWISPKLII